MTEGSQGHDTRRTWAELRSRKVVQWGLAYAAIAWGFLQGLEYLGDTFDWPARIQQVVTIALAVGLPITLVIAWYHGDRGAQRVTGVELAIVAVLMLAGGGIIWRYERAVRDVATPQVTRAAAAAEASIAVLPFVNMSADPDNEYFSDGVAEEILNVLARIPELKVTARTSTFTYKGSNATVAEVARDLGVNHVLEGSVRKEGNRVRVGAQLIEAATGFRLWSETYDRELLDIFEIQDDIARAVAIALRVRLLPTGEQPNLTGTTQLEAYELHLQGVNEWHLRTAESLERARELFERAIELDPGFARAHAYLALTWAVIPDYTDQPLSRARENARESAEAALALDPRSIEAATARILSTESAPRQLEYARQALALDSGFATTHQWAGRALLAAGDDKAARREYEIARDLSPRSRVVLDNLAGLYMLLGEFDAAERVLAHLDSIAPDFPPLQEALFTIHLLRGERERAEQAGQRLVRRLDRRRNAVPLYLDLFLAPPQRSAAAAEIASFPLDDWSNPDNPSLIGFTRLPVVLATAGAHAEALRVLEWVRFNKGTMPLGMLRSARIVQEFSCRPDVQEFFAASGLPPMVEPHPCDGGPTASRITEQ